MFRALSADWGSVLETLHDVLDTAPAPFLVVSDKATGAIHPGLHAQVRDLFGDALLLAEIMPPGTLADARTLVLFGQDPRTVKRLMLVLDREVRVCALTGLARMMAAAGSCWKTPPVLVLPPPALIFASVEGDRSPLQVHAEAVADLVAEALLHAGRDLTQARLLAGFDAIAAGPLETDYTAAALTGSSEVGFLTLAPE